MVSAAEQLAANLNFSALAKAEELKKRIWFTLGALLVYRLGTYIPLPGIDPSAWEQIFRTQAGGILGMFNMFAGGGINRMAIFALNIMPYISASIIIQLMTTVSPTLEALKKEGEAGRKIINQYTRYLTVVLAAFQAYGISVGLEGAGNVVTEPGMFFRISTVITLTGGTMFLMWLGEQITARGIGNGISLIILAGIVAELPSAIAGTLELGRQGALSTGLILLVLVMAVVVIAFIVFMERAQRRLLIQYPKRQVGNRMFEGQSSHLPLKLNTSGVIPPIFASSLLLLPTTVANFNAGQGPEWLTTITTQLGHGRPLFLILYIGLIVFFAFFYTAIVFNPTETADNLKKHGGFIPGIRPGERTAEYIDYVLSRITVVGAAYLAIVCLIPEILISYAAVPFYFGGTSLLIVVSVTMDTVAQVQGYLLAHQYEGLIKRSKLRGRSAMRLDSARSAGGREGHAGAASGREARHRAALDRRHAARGGRGRHAGRPEGQGHHGARRTRARRGRGRDHRRPHRPAGRQAGLHPRRLPAHGRRRPRRWNSCWPRRASKLDAVIELKVDDGILLERIETRVAEMQARGETVRADDNPESLKKRLAAYHAQTAPLSAHYRGKGMLRDDRRHGPDRRGLGGDCGPARGGHGRCPQARQGVQGLGPKPAGKAAKNPPQQGQSAPRRASRSASKGRSKAAQEGSCGKGPGGRSPRTGPKSRPGAQGEGGQASPGRTGRGRKTVKKSSKKRVSTARRRLTKRR